MRSDRFALSDARILRRGHALRSWLPSSRQGEQALDEDERIEVGVFSGDAAWRLVASGEIADMKTVLALYWIGEQSR